MRAARFRNRHLRPPVLSDALITWRGLFEPSEKVCKAVLSSLVPLRVETSTSESMEESGRPHMAGLLRVQKVRWQNVLLLYRTVYYCKDERLRVIKLKE